MNLSKLVMVLGVSLSTAVYSASSMEMVSTKTLHVGVEAGMTFSNINSPSDIQTTNRTGFAAGALIELPLAPLLSAQLEALYVQRGANVVTAGNLEYSIKSDTLEIPVFAKLTLNESISPFLIAGPVAIFNLNNRVELNTPGSTTSLGYDPKTVDFAVAFGGGVDLGPVFLSARYTLGITELNSNSVGWKSRGFNILAGVRI
jgi:opacity protein-like surface antigen